MGSRIGIIAGSGEFPLLLLQELVRQGKTCFVAGVKGEASPNLEKSSPEFLWLEAGELQKLLCFFKENQVQEAFFAGKVKLTHIFDRGKFDDLGLRLLHLQGEWTPEFLLKAVIDFLAREGISILDPTPFLSAHFCAEGVLTGDLPSEELRQDIEFGWPLAKKISDLEIGQTLIVKGKTVIAVEGIEGTDEAIRRAGQLVREGIVAIKVGRSRQDPRIDLPGIGFSTLQALVEARGAALCLEAERMPFFQKEESLGLARANKILIMAKKSR